MIVRHRTLDDVVPKVDLPEGAAGDWRVERFTIAAEDVELENARLALTPGGGRWQLEPGTYTRLVRGGRLWMSDVHGERYDHLGFVQRARGRVLITGLGLGMVAAACLAKPGVESVTVVELEPAVIVLAAETLYRRFNADAPRLFVHLADAFTWAPNQRDTQVAEPHRLRFVSSPSTFDSVWHDVWVESGGDVYEEQKRLRRRYARWITAGGFQDCWRAAHCRYAATGRWR